MLPHNFWRRSIAIFTEIKNAGRNIVERELAVMSEYRHCHSTSGGVRHL